MEERDIRILDRMRALCSVREYCTKDVREKVLKDADADSCEEILRVLKEEGFLSDKRYAAAFARDKSYLLGWGPQKIRFALYAKQIDDEAVREALSLIDEAAAENRLIGLLGRKLASLRTSKKDLSEDELRSKLIRFAVGRGYSFDETGRAVSKLLSDGRD